MAPNRTIVTDLGSNSFRMVVYEWEAGSWWRRADQLLETVKIGAGLDATGELSEEGIERGLRAVSLFDHARRAFRVDVADTICVATSAIRDARNSDEFIARAEALSSVPIRILSSAEEARYGMLAAVNSTTLSDGWTLDIGGGSMQLCQVRNRRSERAMSWPLGAVRMTEHFLSGPSDRPADGSAIKALRKHAVAMLEESGIEADAGAMVTVGGAVRNLATAARIEDGLPAEVGIQGYALARGRLDDLIERLAALPAVKRRSIPGIKAGRGEIILAAAIAVRAAMGVTGAESIEVTEAGLREGLFFERFLQPSDPPLFADVRGASVRNLALQHRVEVDHAEHVADLALGMYDSLKGSELKVGNGRLRELLWAACILHDVGKTIDYDDHHLHSLYLILGAGLPGYTPRELALIALLARYHRKGSPEAGTLAPLLESGDEARLMRCSALLRIAEYLERGRDGSVREASLSVNRKRATLHIEADDDAALARWGAERQAGLFADAFGRDLSVA